MPAYNESGGSMKRRFCAVLLALMIFANSVFADINPEDIYISDPVSNYIVVGGSPYLAVNIKNFTPNAALSVSISRKFSVITDEDVLALDLPVSKLELIAPKFDSFDRRVNFNELTNKEDPELFSKQVRETIENYFKYRKNESATDDTLLLFSGDEPHDKSTVMRYWRTRYQFLFEKQVFTDIIESPSYCTPLSGFEVGSYVIRFVDADGYVLKEVFVDVVEPEQLIDGKLPFVVAPSAGTPAVGNKK